MSTPLIDTKRTLNTGDLVISVSEIFDRLQTKIDPDTLEAILRDIISRHRRQVRPGELITADLMNQILAQLESLEVRVTKLEAGSSTTPLPSPVITDWQPHDEVQIGRRLDVTGKNFPTVMKEDSVTLGGQPIQTFIFFSPTQLSFDIPPTVAPGTPTLKIRNAEGATASQNIHVVAQVEIPHGHMFVNDVTPPRTDKFEVGKSYTFVFELNSQSIPDEDYTLRIDYTDVKGTASADEWKKNSSLAMANTGGAVPSPIRLGPAQRVRVNVNVKIPSGAESANLSLSAISLNNPLELNRTSSPIKIEIGQRQEENNPHASFSIGTIPTGSAVPLRKAEIDGNKESIEVRYNKTVAIPLNFTCTAAGAYSFSAELEQAMPTVWALPTDVNNPSPSPPSFQSGATGNCPVSVRLQLLMTDADPSGQHTEKNILKVKARRAANAAADSLGEFTSFIRIPIQGFK